MVSWSVGHSLTVTDRTPDFFFEIKAPPVHSIKQEYKAYCLYISRLQTVVSQQPRQLGCFLPTERHAQPDYEQLYYMISYKLKF